MRFAMKIFAVSYLAVVITFGLGGFAMLEVSFRQGLDSRRETVLAGNEALCVAWNTVAQSAGEGDLTAVFRHQVSGRSAGGERTAIGGVSELTSPALPGGDALLQGLEVGQRASGLLRDGEGWCLAVVSRLSDGADGPMYVETVADFTDLYANRQANYRVYRAALVAVALAASGTLALISARLTRPLGSVGTAARRIAGGELAERVPDPGGGDEVGLLARDFNRMADAVQEKVAQLEDANRRQQEFVANFTHELKTPLTSIIGYADMLRSYDLTAAERREAAEYIYREGRRLEGLSLHLLDLLVLERSAPELTPTDAQTLCAEVEQATRFLARKYGVAVQVRCQPARILVQPVLVKTLLYNLIDNACKASTTGQRVVLRGRPKEGRFELSVRDYGRGMPAGELARITEPFYMVDKSRARSQGGAGLGLALCKRIAALHGSPLAFASRPGEGTLAGFAAALAPEEVTEP